MYVGVMGRDPPLYHQRFPLLNMFLSTLFEFLFPTITVVPYLSKFTHLLHIICSASNMNRYVDISLVFSILRAFLIHIRVHGSPNREINYADALSICNSAESLILPQDTTSARA